MSSVVVERARRRWFLGLLAVLVAMIATMALRAALDRPAISTDARLGQQVFNDVDALIEQTAQIVVTLADERYQLVSAGDGWRMDTAAGYPIRADRLATLAEGLKSMRWADARTQDPRKHDQIGVGDPEAGGNGALVSFLGAEGEPLASIVTGRRGGQIYARRPDEQTAYRIDGDLPPFYSRDAWMDFAVVDLAAETIQLVEIEDRIGDRIVLSRSAGAGPDGFAPALPFGDMRLLTPLSASGAGLALSRFAPIDAKQAEALTGPPVARLITVTFDGLEIVANAHDEADGGYVTLRAVEAGNAAARAQSINAEAGGWAFKLAPLDYQEMTTPVSTIAISRP